MDVNELPEMIEIIEKSSVRKISVTKDNDDRHHRQQYKCSKIGGNYAGNCGYS